MSPKIRESIYYIGAAIPSVLGLALIWGGIDQGAADSIGDIIAGVVNLLGATAPATAAIKVRKQRKDGTFETPTAAEQVSSGVQAIIQAQQKAQADYEAVKGVITGAANQIPGVGPLAGQLINAALPFVGAPAYSDPEVYRTPVYQPAGFVNHDAGPYTQPDVFRGARFQ